MRKARAETERTPIFPWIAVILVVTAISYYPATQNLFTNWDDPGYILENPGIKHLTPADVGRFFTSFHKGNYHPVTMLSFALDYRFSELSPKWYHVVNVFLHLLNTLAVFVLTRALLALRNEPRAVQVGLVAALLFGVHPFHVESVAWVVGRKDLLYALFFLGSLIAYCRHLSSPRPAFYLVALFSFVLALFSKGQAVTLPVILVAIDLVAGKSLRRPGAVLEKVPFLALSLIFGVIAIIAQRSTEAVGDVTAYPFHQRIAFASYGLVKYLGKLVLPVNLSAFYPYVIRPGESLPAQYWLFPLIAAALGAFLVFAIRRDRWIAFGLAFFVINLLLVLQLLPVGNAIMADRYSYLPSVGFFLIVALLYRRWGMTVRSARSVPIVVLSICAALLGSLTFARCQVWHDSHVLWSDVLAKHPDSPVAWNNRGIALKDSGDFAGAISDYSRALELDPRYPLAYSNRGIARQRLGDFEGALQDLARAIALDPNDSGAYVNRGVVRIRLGQSDDAIADFTRALELDSGNAAAYSNRGTLRSNLGQSEAAIADLDRALYLNPGQPDALISRALARSGLGDPASALADLDLAIQVRPESGVAYYLRGNIHLERNQQQAACSDFSRAAQLGYVPANEKLQLHCGQ